MYSSGVRTPRTIIDVSLSSVESRYHVEFNILSPWKRDLMKFPEPVRPLSQSISSYSSGAPYTEESWDFNVLYKVLICDSEYEASATDLMSKRPYSSSMKMI